MQLQQTGSETDYINLAKTPTPRLGHFIQVANGFSEADSKGFMQIQKQGLSVRQA